MIMIKKRFFLIAATAISTFFVIFIFFNLNSGNTKDLFNTSTHQNYEKSQSCKKATEDLFLQQNQLPKVKINQILNDANDNTWIATNSSSLWEKAKDKQIFTQVKNADINNKMPIFCLKEDQKKHLFVGSADGLYENKGPGDLQFTMHTELGNGDEILTMDIDKNGKMWIGTHQDGLWWKDQNSQTFLHSDFGITQGNQNANYVISYIFADANTNLWVQTSNHGLWVYVGGGEKYSENYFQGEDMKKTSANSILDIGKNSLWIGGSGLYKYEYKDDIKKGQMVPKQKLANNLINVIKKDQSNNFWFGTEFGLWEFKQGSGEINLNTSVSKTNIVTIVEGNKGRIWAGSCNTKQTSNNGLWAETEQGSDVFTKNININDDVTTITTATDKSATNDIWVATLRNNDQYSTSRLWLKSNNAVKILPKKGTHVVYNNNSTDNQAIPDENVFFSGPFSIIIYTPNKYSIEINDHAVTNIPNDNTFSFPNSKYNEAVVNKKIKIHLIFSDKTDLTLTSLIKNDFFDNGFGDKDRLINAFTPNTTDLVNKVTLTTVNVAGDPKNKQWPLLYFLAARNNPKPTLKFDISKFNFFIDTQKSAFFTEVSIKNRKVVVNSGSAKTFSNIDGGIFIIHNRHKDKGYLGEIDLYDKLENKYSFLVQVGGNTVNSEFSPQWPKKQTGTSIVPGVVSGSIVILIGISVIFIGLKYRKKARRLKIVNTRNYNKVITRKNNITKTTHNSQKRNMKIKSRKTEKRSSA